MPSAEPKPLQLATTDEADGSGMESEARETFHFPPRPAAGFREQCSVSRAISSLKIFPISGFRMTASMKNALRFGRRPFALGSLYLVANNKRPDSAV